MRPPDPAPQLRPADKEFIVAVGRIAAVVFSAGLWTLFALMVYGLIAGMVDEVAAGMQPDDVNVPVAALVVIGFGAVAAGLVLLQRRIWREASDFRTSPRGPSRLLLWSLDVGLTRAPWDLMAAGIFGAVNWLTESFSAVTAGDATFANAVIAAGTGWFLLRAVDDILTRFYEASTAYVRAAAKLGRSGDRVPPRVRGRWHDGDNG